MVQIIIAITIVAVGFMLYMKNRAENRRIDRMNRLADKQEELMNRLKEKNTDKDEN